MRFVPAESIPLPFLFGNRNEFRSRQVGRHECDYDVSGGYRRPPEM